jgi:hypothetical protein
MAIFDKFYQVRQSKDLATPGTGLGLPIAKTWWSCTTGASGWRARSAAESVRLHTAIRRSRPRHYGWRELETPKAMAGKKSTTRRRHFVPPCGRQPRCRWCRCFLLPKSPTQCQAHMSPSLQAC